jgi:hypothetical protein
VLAPLSGAAAVVHLGLILILTMGFAFYPLAGLMGRIRRRFSASGMGARGLRASRLGGTQRLIIAAGLFTTLGLPIGSSAPMALAPGDSRHCRRLHSRDRRQLVAFPPPW